MLKERTACDNMQLHQLEKYATYSHVSGYEIFKCIFHLTLDTIVIIRFKLIVIVSVAI